MLESEGSFAPSAEFVAGAEGDSTPREPEPPEISIVVPVFNEAASLPILLDEITEAMAGWGERYEVVVVDDGSTDSSLGVLDAFASGEPRLRLLASSARSGQSAALAAGLRAARGRVVVTLDADLQNDPRDIPKLIEALPGCEIVSGVRRHRQDPWDRRVSSRIANAVRRRLLHDEVHDVGCSLKAYRREVLQDLPVFSGMHRFLPALAGLRGARVREIEVSHRPRRFGRSKYGIGNRLWRGLADLLGVWWLRRRWVDLSAYEER